MQLEHTVTWGWEDTMDIVQPFQIEQEILPRASVQSILGANPATRMRVTDDGKVFLEWDDAAPLSHIESWNHRLFNLIRMLDAGIGDPKESARFKDMSNEFSLAKKIYTLARRASPGLKRAVDRLIKSANPEDSVPKPVPGTRRAIFNTNKIETIDTKYMGELRALLEQVALVQKDLPEILSITPFYLGSAKNAKVLSHLLILLDFWQVFPKHIWTLIWEKELSDASYLQKSLSVHYRHPIPDISLWYWEVHVNAKKNGKSTNQSLSRQLGKISGTQPPNIFPFIRKYGGVKSELSLSHFEKIILLSPWVGACILSQNFQQINPTIIAFFQKHKAFLLPHLHEETNELIEVLIRIFTLERFEGYLKKYCLEVWEPVQERKITPSSGKGFQKRPNKNLDLHSLTEYTRVRLVATEFEFSPPLPPGYTVQIAERRDWPWEDAWGIQRFLLNKFVEANIFVRIIPPQAPESNPESDNRNPKVVFLGNDLLKYRSPELEYITRNPVRLKNEYTLRQIFLEKKQAQAKDVILEWPYPHDIRLFISLNGWENWSSYAPDDILDTRSFAWGWLLFAFSPTWDTPIDEVKQVGQTLQKKAFDVIAHVPKKTEAIIEKPITSMQSVDNLAEETALELYDEFQKWRYTLLKDDLWNTRLSFTTEKYNSHELVIRGENDVIYTKGNSEVGDLFLSLAREDVIAMVRKQQQSEKTEADNHIIARLKPLESYIWKLSVLSSRLFPLDNIISSAEMFDFLRHNGDGYAWVLNFHNGKRPVLEWMKNRLKKLGVTITFIRVSVKNPHKEDPLGRELLLNLSLDEHLGISGNIHSLKQGGYTLSVNEWMSEKLRQKIESILINLLVHLGVIGKYNPDESKSRRIGVSDVIRIVEWEKSQITHDMLSKDDQKIITSAAERFHTGRWKLCDEFWFSHADGCYESNIHSRKSFADITCEGYDGFVVLVDEKLSSVSGNRQGQVEVYNLLQNNTRIQKYIILKMVATITGDDYKWKSPFTGTMYDEFKNYWESLDVSRRKIFTELAMSSTDEALLMKSGEEQYDDLIVAGLMEHWRMKKVQIIYSRPKLIPADEFLSLVKDFWNT